MAETTNAKKRIGLAFQGGVIPAGSFAAGVVGALVDTGAFDSHDVVAFSGTSAGALVASVCWGYSLEGRIGELSEVLRQQWLDLAYGIIPNAKVADMAMLVDHLARLNPVYDSFKQNMVVPWFRAEMRDWASKYIDFDAWIERFQDPRFDDSDSEYGRTPGRNAGRSPGLLLGTTDVLEGEVKVIEVVDADDFTLQTVLASGSLDEANGLTWIKRGPHQGVYLDGAWAVNPPISDMIQCRVDEIWLVRVFPKTRAAVPEGPGERKDRRDELWQNSLVEHELDKIAFVNKWRDALNAGITAIDPQHRPFRPITVRVIEMERDLPARAAMINTESFITDMIDYGYRQAHRFMQER